MAAHQQGNQPAHDGDSLANEELERLDTYISTLARKKVPRNIVPQELIDLEIDELIQNTRIKFWLAHQKTPIQHPEAYIRILIRNEAVNIVRRYRATSQLLLDEDGEIRQGVPVAAGQEEQDPLQQFLQKEKLSEYMARAVNAVVTLPSCQQRAVICSLKDHMDDIVQLANAFKIHKVDIKGIQWPKEKQKQQSYRASLHIARNKLNVLVKRP